MAELQYENYIGLSYVKILIRRIGEEAVGYYQKILLFCVFVI